LPNTVHHGVRSLYLSRDQAELVADGCWFWFVGSNLLNSFHCTWWSTTNSNWM
jgi:hypothetical protein